MRSIIYILVAVLAFGSVFLKARQLEDKDKKEIISISEEWEENGIPVSVSEVSIGNIPCMEKISGIYRTPGIIECAVPENTASKLRRGQHFKAQSANDKSPAGTLLSKSRRPDMLTGLYRVRLRITNGITLPAKTIVIAKVTVSNLTDAVRFDSEALVEDSDNAGGYVWVIQQSDDGMYKALKRTVQTGLSCPEYIQAIKGLHPGEKVCINGMNNLKENVKVLPVDQEGKIE